MKNERAVFRAYDKAKDVWAQNLEVGDLVEDCRYKVLKIKTINHQFRSHYPLAKYALVDGAEWLEDNIPWLYRLYNLFEDNVIFKLTFYNTWVDADLELEDGNWCSATNCCDIPDYDQVKIYEEAHQVINLP